MMQLLATVLPELRQAGEIAEDIIWRGTFDGRFAEREHALRVFTDHIREVGATVPPDRLLVFDVREGWWPLCTFLGVPVPQGEPFPHVNDAASFQRMVRQRLTESGLRVARPVVLASAGVAALSWIKRRTANRRTGTR